MTDGFRVSDRELAYIVVCVPIRSVCRSERDCQKVFQRKSGGPAEDSVQQSFPGQRSRFLISFSDSTLNMKGKSETMYTDTHLLHRSDLLRKFLVTTSSLLVYCSSVLKGFDVG